MVNYKHPIGLFGGTFDPIHCGHIKIAENLLKTLNLQSVHFIPNKAPPHRPAPIASADDRFTMVRIATARHPDFIVNDIELARPAPSYTIDTLTTLRSLIPHQPICLIIGIDEFINFNKWYFWEKIPDLVHLVIVNRPGFELPSSDWLEKLLKKRHTQNRKLLGMEPGGSIFFVDMKPIYISATDIRHKIKHNDHISEIISSDVLSYIKEHHLYT
jgi:nicotinate-nucleotide adenylyltransferase